MFSIGSLNCPCLSCLARELLFVQASSENRSKPHKFFDLLIAQDHRSPMNFLLRNTFRSPLRFLEHSTHILPSSHRDLSCVPFIRGQDGLSSTFLESTMHSHCTLHCKSPPPYPSVSRWFLLHFSRAAHFLAFPCTLHRRSCFFPMGSFWCYFQSSYTSTFPFSLHCARNVFTARSLPVPP